MAWAKSRFYSFTWAARDVEQLPQPIVDGEYQKRTLSRTKQYQGLNRIMRGSELEPPQATES